MGLVGGLLLAASLPPWPVATGAWPLGLVGAAVLYGALDGGTGRQRLAVGMAAGFGLYLPALVWMRDFSLPGYLVATLLQAAILAAGVALVPGTDARRWRRAAAFPAALVVVEAVRGSWPFGGMPISGIDLGQIGGPLAPAARIGGRLLLVALVGVGGLALAGLVRRRWPAACAGVAVVVAMAALGVVAPDGSVDRTLRVAAVQGGGPRGLRAVGRDPAPVFQRHVDATAGVRRPVDLVLWPEDVVDIEREVATAPEGAILSSLADSLDTTLVAGVVQDEEGGRFRNSAVPWGPDGAIYPRYDKVHRVPFGEYVPARSFFDRIADLSAVPRDATAGRGPAILDTPAGRLGVVISYEVFFPDRAREAVRSGGRVVLVPTNAASYRDAQIPSQEVAAARLRGLETGRWVVQAAPTGYSAVIDHRGDVRVQGGLGGAEILHDDVDLRTGRTLYVTLGSTPWLAAAVVVLLLASRKPEWMTSRFVDQRSRSGYNEGTSHRS
ncbi:MAG: Apolipoprotein N-acyltransferase / Copper homeostasis protein CutE [uncultured Acidimicrobiales bacterium]|uniref:Apolipoprotein N-acyltransferase n=1 Tax=uncultured Acidimicrobiales bacterium TaxID=310071 RepID=A0A6J4JCD0_9ACTN|nr:MAG: Apolipoprotein N-acyltransferase / Copper homeostasis protein CutE [uncultured Acidimicrobiales bacterium]